MLVMAPCPSPSDLERLASGRMTEPEAQSLAAHLNDCERCLVALRGLRVNDTLVEALSTVNETWADEQPNVDALIGLLRRLGPCSSHVDGDVTASDEPSDNLTDAWNRRLAPAEQPDELGRLGNYRVLRIIGAGGMGVVFLAEDLQLKRPVALKVMNPTLAARADARQRFLREARSAAAIDHESIVTVHQVGEDRGLPFLAMPLLRGESLESRLRGGQRLPWAEAVRIGIKIADALAAAHGRGLIHRDIKPGNIWLEERHPDHRSSEERVKLLDFGLARSQDADSELTRSGAIVGTPAYMAPEQAEGKTVDARTDLYGLGCVLYRLCTGRVPFEGPTVMSVLLAAQQQAARPVREIDADVPARLSDLIDRLLKKRREDRPLSARAVADELAAIAAGDSRVSASTAPTGPHTPAVMSAWRRVTFGLLVALMLLGVVVLFGIPQLVIRIKDRDGKVTEVPVPVGGSVEIAPGNQVGKLGFAPLDMAWVDKVQRLNPNEQVLEVADELVRRNPGFEGVVWRKSIEDGRVTAFAVTTETIHDISPIRALRHLKDLDLQSNVTAGKLTDLSPLRGMELERICLHGNSKLKNLTPLKGMHLKALLAVSVPFEDLTPLQGMPLEILQNLYSSAAHDLTPLRGMSLKELSVVTVNGKLDVLRGMPLEILVAPGPVSDLTPLRGMALKTLHLDSTELRDVSVLKGMPLEGLLLRGPVKDLSVLRGMPLKGIGLTGVQVRSLDFLSDSPLESLRLENVPVKDLMPLSKCPLKEVHLVDVPIADVGPLKGIKIEDFVAKQVPLKDIAVLASMALKQVRLDEAMIDAGVLRPIATLKTINGKPAAEFWKDYDTRSKQSVP